ncbi:MAG: hypothetical protein IKV21_06160 [Clostridia bacterium]|nr:hypothetical protein [Clostridia bacterium]
MKKTVFILCLIFTVIITGFALSQKDAPDDVTSTEYSAEFPVITKAVLYRNGIPEDIEFTDYRLEAAINYIMTSVQESSYGWIQGVLHIYDIEINYMPQDGMYMVLDVKTETSELFDRYDKVIISQSSVIFIDSDSESKLNADTPFNKCITPYFNNYTSSDSIPDILPKFF